jgi:hypothetical protein
MSVSVLKSALAQVQALTDFVSRDRISSMQGEKMTHYSSHRCARTQELRPYFPALSATRHL